MMLPVLLLQGLQLQDAQSGWQKDLLQKGLGLMCHVPVSDVTAGSSGFGVGHLVLFSPVSVQVSMSHWEVEFVLGKSCL